MASNNWILWTVCIFIFFGSLRSKPHSGTSTVDSTVSDCERDVKPLNCSNHNATFLLMGNINRSLFVTDNFSRTFCDNNAVPTLGIDMFVQNTQFPKNGAKRKWLNVERNVNGYVLLHLTKWHTEKELNVYILSGKNCSKDVNTTKGRCENEDKEGTCKIKCLKTNQVCKNANYHEEHCHKMSRQDHTMYYVNVTRSKFECINCNNPVKKPEVEVQLNERIPDLPPLPVRPEEPLDPEIADKVMSSMTSDFANQFNESSVLLTMGESVSGVLVKQIDPVDMQEVSFGYAKDGFSILDDRNALNGFSRSLTVSKEAFEKAQTVNNTKPFAAIFRFLNMSKDKKNSTVLADEVIAVEMGAQIKNLTDKININFFNLNYKGNPSCNSWNGNGSRPVWTSEGCQTVRLGNNITCCCSHLTFFAVLLTPLNETISTDDLNTLTTITRVGCGLSMFFLAIVLFLHFIVRKARSSNSTQILIHLVLAMFLLDFAFLINDLVAKAKNMIGCKIMAAAMHYFMLTTFTWFAAHALHLCLQLYHGGKIEIKRYVFKVSVTTWVLPSVIGIILLSLEKYGEVVINTGNAATSVSMCWILDNDVHYIVNIGYYALVFIFTFSTFILMLTWFCRMNHNNKAGAQGKNSSICQRMVSVMGLCCILGVTWGCAFFAYGIFRVPAYYCFTILNSFQGFCLFIYYHKTSHIVETKDPSSSSSSSSTTLKTNLDEIFNPYDQNSAKPKPE